MNRALALPAILILASSTLSSCASDSVIAVTGTTIGVEISENPATQIPHAKLGYNRAELAFVPTNRSAASSSSTKLGGAEEVADVLMELKYAGIFSWGASGGIYQRLAVGPRAVQQPGAALMFARDTTGGLDERAAEAIRSLNTRAVTPSIAMAFMLDVYEALSAIAATDQKAKSAVDDLDELGLLRPVYDFRRYNEDPSGNLTLDAPGGQIEDAAAGVTGFRILHVYRGTLLESIRVLQSATQANPAPPNAEELRRYLTSQEDKLDTFDKDFGSRPAVRNAAEYFWKLLSDQERE